ncbi:MAG: alpha-L-fucosidase 2 [Arcticibacterium sp.]|jgi:alpha-L-fucosidase 2
MHDAFLSFIDNLESRGRVTSRTFYGASGWTCGHSSEIWATGGTWVATHLFDRYQFSQDKDWLASYAYPFMKGAAEFCLDILLEGPDGYLVSSTLHITRKHLHNRYWF